MSENNQTGQTGGLKAFLNRPIKVPEGKPPRTMGREILSWVLTIAAAVAIALLIRTFLFELYRVDGASMTNTLADGERTFCTKLDYLIGGPKRGDVVICHFPDRGGTYFVKRLVALPGDTVEIRDYKLYVNDELVEDPPEMNSRPYSDYPKRTLGEDEYFVIGDNRGNSHDSRARDVGPLTRSQIVAHVRFVLFPFNKIRAVK